MQDIVLGGVPSALAFFPLGHDMFNKHPTRKEAFYGLDNGDLGQLFLDASSHYKGTSVLATGQAARITALYSGFDMTHCGVDDIAVGRKMAHFRFTAWLPVVSCNSCARIASCVASICCYFVKACTRAAQTSTGTDASTFKLACDCTTLALCRCGRQMCRTALQPLQAAL